MYEAKVVLHAFIQNYSERKSQSKKFFLLSRRDGKVCTWWSRFHAERSSSSSDESEKQGAKSKISLAMFFYKVNWIFWLGPGCFMKVVQFEWLFQLHFILEVIQGKFEVMAYNIYFQLQFAGIGNFSHDKSNFINCTWAVLWEMSWKLGNIFLLTWSVYFPVCKMILQHWHISYGSLTAPFRDGTLFGIPG